MAPRERRTRLVGRDVEAAHVRTLVDGVADGRGFALLVVGGAGLGKSRLADAAADVGRAAGFQVRSARAHHLHVSAPYGLVLDAFGLRATDLATAPEAGASRTMLEAGAMGAPSFLLGERLEERLEEESLQRPVLLIVEDLHWSDRESLAWLWRLVARVGAARVGLLATTRPPRPAGESAWALADWGGARLDLEPLSAPAVAELAADALSAPPGPRLVEALEGASGTPLLALALIDALQAANALADDGGCVELERPAAELPAGEAVTAQICEVEADTLRVLQVAAVLGRTLTLADLAAVLDRRVIDVMPALDDAAAAGVFLVAEPHGIGFRHELYRDAVLATLPAAAREALHLDVARTLAAAGAPALDVAEHFAQGARPGNQEAVAWLQRAAVDVVAHAPGTALRLLDIALPLCPSVPPPELLMARVQALAAAGHAAEAEALGRSLLRDGLTPDVEARLRRELALSYFVQGRAAACVVEMDRVRELHDRELHDGEQHAARVHAELAFARFVGLDHAAARESAGTAVEEGRRSGDVAAVVGGTAVLALLDLLSDRFDAALRLADEIDLLASQPNAIEAHIYQPWFAAGLVRLEADHLDDLARTVRHGRRVAERTGAAWAIPGYDALTSFAALRTGELDDADTIARATLDYLDGVDGFGVAVWCHAFAATAAIHRGEDAAAATLLDAADRVLGSARQFGWEQVAAARARWHERAGRPDDALAALRAVWEAFGAFGILSGRQEIGPALARLAVGAGERGLATDVVSELARGADATGCLAFRVAAERAAAWTTADADRALAAVTLARQTPRRPTVAGALEDAAALLEAVGRRTETKACAIEAAERWLAMGATGDADRTAARFLVSTPRGRRPRSGFDALTASERRVIDLVADGLPNAEIARQLYISRRTVESHTSSAYRKLGVSSRVELATAALRARDR